MNIIYRKYLVLYSLLIIIFIGVNIIGTSSIRKIFIDGDGSGHYAYLPSLIIYHTLDFTDVFTFEKSQRPPDYMGHYFHKYDNILINKYTSGTALLQLPFFLVGYLLSLLLGFPLDGYNVVFQYSIAIGTLFWVGLGLMFFVRLLTTYSIDRKFAWLMSVVCLLGTNLFFYTFVDPSFSHAYSFSIITIFLYYVRTVFIDYSRSRLVLSAFLLGIIVLIRPANIIVIAILPFLSGSYSNFINVIKLKIQNHDYIFTILAFFIGVGPQLIINYIQTGSPVIYGYKNEGFYFSDPQIFNFLFSFKKGWFVYSPIFLLLFPGLIYMWRSQTKFTFISFISFFGILVYIFSSWWNWYYGDSFGMRPMVDYYGLFMLVIALFLYNSCRQWVKIIGFVFIALAILLNLAQSYQYARGIIHADSMTKEAYWHVFLDINDESINCISGGDETYYGHLNEKPFFQTYNSIDRFDKGWAKSSNTTTQFANSDSLSVIQNSKLIFSPSYRYFFDDSLIGYDNIYVKFSTKYLEVVENAADRAVFVVDIQNKNGENVFYKSFRVKHITNDVVDGWQDGSIGFKLPEITGDMKYAKFYVWNVGKNEYFLDDLEISLYTYSY